MNVLFNLPSHLPKSKLLWTNKDLTYLIGYNGTGKTLTIMKMAAWCESKGYSYVVYDALMALYEAPELIENATDQELKIVCKQLSDFSLDFQDDLKRWVGGSVEDALNDSNLLRSVLRMVGNGYTRMFVMLYKVVLSEPDYYFLDLPETSLHIAIAREWPRIIMNFSPLTKFVISTHSPDIFREEGNYQTIDMDEPYQETTLEYEEFN